MGCCILDPARGRSHVDRRTSDCGAVILKGLLVAFVQFENAPLWPFSPGVSVCVIGYAERFPDDKAPPGQPCFVSVVVITCASHAQGRRFEPGTKQYFCAWLPEPWPAWRPATTHALNLAACHCGFYGVMVSTLDFESSDPSSNLGGTLRNSF